MDSTSTTERVTSSEVSGQSGNVDEQGEIVGELIKRLRRHVGPIRDIDPVDPDEQADLAALLVLCPELFRGTVIS